MRGDSDRTHGTGRGLGPPRGSDPDAFGERGSAEEPADITRTSRDPAEGGDLGLPGGDRPTAAREDERRRTPR